MKNKGKAKAIFILIALLLIITSLYYVSSYIFLKAYSINLNTVNPFIIFSYYNAYYGQNEQLDKHLELAIALPIIAPVILAFIILLKGKEKALHGEAKFASFKDIRENNLFFTPKKEDRERQKVLDKKLNDTLLLANKPKIKGNSKLIVPDKSILLGKFNGKYLYFSGMQFAYLSAPTRSGKGVGIVIPNCLTYTESMVVLDIKYENFEITSGYRHHVLGQEIYRFSPFDEEGKTHCYNPLDYISDNPAKRVSDINAIGGALYKLSPDEKDPFWKDNAKALFRGICLMVLENPKFDKTLGQIARIGAGMGMELKDYLVQELNTPFKNDKGETTSYSISCSNAIMKIISNSDNTLSGIVSSFLTPLDTFENAYVDAATSKSDFNLRDVRKKKMTIYLGVQPKYLDQASTILNLFFSQLIAENTVELPSEKNPYQCLLLMDEFTSLGRVGALSQAIAYMAGYNMRPFIIIQNREQLESAYGKADATTLLANFATMIIYPPTSINVDEATKISEMLGYDTVKNKSKSRSNPVGFGNGSSSASESISDQRRALMLPQEILAMKFEEEIVKVNNSKPIFANKILYFKDPDFTSRAKLPCPHIHTIDVDSFQREISDKTNALKKGVNLSESNLAQTSAPVNSDNSDNSNQEKQKSESEVKQAYLKNLQEIYSKYPDIKEEATKEELPSDIEKTLDTQAQNLISLDQFSDTNTSSKSKPKLDLDSSNKDEEMEWGDNTEDSSNEDESNSESIIYKDPEFEQEDDLKDIFTDEVCKPTTKVENISSKL